MSHRPTNISHRVDAQRESPPVAVDVGPGQRLDVDARERVGPALSTRQTTIRTTFAPTTTWWPSSSAWRSSQAPTRSNATSRDSPPYGAASWEDSQHARGVRLASANLLQVPPRPATVADVAERRVRLGRETEGLGRLPRREVGARPRAIDGRRAVSQRRRPLGRAFVVGETCRRAGRASPLGRSAAACSSCWRSTSSPPRRGRRR